MRNPFSKMSRRPKIMMTARDTIPNTAILFQEMRENFFFGKVIDDRYAYVTPYVIIIDGQDVLASLNAEGQWVIGFPAIVEKPRWHYKKGAEGFDALIGKAISKAFHETYETSLVKGEYSILCTSRAVYTLDNRVALPICWLVVPNDRPVGIRSKKGDDIAPLSMKDCFEGCAAINSQHYLTSIVGHLVAAKDIDLPIFSYKSSMHPDL